MNLMKISVALFSNFLAFTLHSNFQNVFFTLKNQQDNISYPYSF